MPTYTFRLPARFASTPVTVYNTADVQQTTGTTDSNALFAASLPTGDYYAKISYGYTSYRAAGEVNRGDLDNISEATVATIGDVRPAAFIDFTTKPDGAAPTTLDTGQAADSVFNATGAAPVISGGKLVTGTLPGSGGYADYFQVPLGAKAQLIGNEFVLPTGANDGNGVHAYGLFASVYEGGGTNVPSSRCHFTIVPGTGTTATWQYGVYRGDGSPLVVPKAGTFTKPAEDGVTPWVPVVTFDEDLGNAYVTLPDDTRVTVTAAEIAAAFTAAGQTPVALRDLGGEVAFVEHFATTGANTAKFSQVKRMWADVSPPSRSAKAVSQRALAKALAANVAPPAATTVYSPTTQLVSTVTTSAANVDATNVKVSGTPGPTGQLTIQVNAYYEFTSADVIFMRVAGSVSSTARVVAKGAAGAAVHAGHTIVITGLTPGKTSTWTLQHWGVVNASASLKAGGSGGSMVPPVSMVATGQ